MSDQEKKRLIIGLGYRARTGKDTVGDYLKRAHNFQQTAFAESLKHACREVFGFTDEQLYGNKKEDVDDFWKFSPRWALQIVGTECFRRNVADDTWVKSVERRIFKSLPALWVITDVRFPNEAEAIQKWGGVVVRVDRKGLKSPLVPRWPHAPNWLTKLLPDSVRMMEHASESSMKTWDGWDFIIENDGTLDQLYVKADKLMRDLGVKT